MNNVDDLFLRLSVLSLFRYTATKCGHRTKQGGLVSAFGRTIITKMPKNENGSVDYCLDCIGRMAIRCVWCGDPIFIGDPVTLHHGSRVDFFLNEAQKTREQDGFVVSDGAVVFRDNSLALIGCLGLNCADTGADLAGFWLPAEDGKGRVRRMPIAYETSS